MKNATQIIMHVLCSFFFFDNCNVSFCFYKILLISILLIFYKIVLIHRRGKYYNMF